jgi:hypothetical protein
VVGPEAQIKRNTARRRFRRPHLPEEPSSELDGRRQRFFASSCESGRRGQFFSGGATLLHIKLSRGGAIYGRPFRNGHKKIHNKCPININPGCISVGRVVNLLVFGLLVRILSSVNLYF